MGRYITWRPRVGEDDTAASLDDETAATVVGLFLVTVTFDDDTAATAVVLFLGVVTLWVGDTTTAAVVVDDDDDFESRAFFKLW